MRWFPLLVVACGVEPVDSMESMTEPPEMRDRLAVIESGEYLTWRCEETSHPARPGSGHARNRICNNELVATTPDGTAFPIGATSVKELLDSSDRIIGYALMEKVAPSEGGRGWYWYEVIGSSKYADGIGSTLCSGCHARAAHDFLFTVVR